MSLDISLMVTKPLDAVAEARALLEETLEQNRLSLRRRNNV